MKTISVTEFKSSLLDIINQVTTGETFEVIADESKEIIGYFVKERPKQNKRILGILEGKAKFTFKPDFKMTEEEFLGYK
jgi:hypothetical protein